MELATLNWIHICSTTFTRQLSVAFTWSSVCLITCIMLQIISCCVFTPKFPSPLINNDLLRALCGFLEDGCHRISDRSLSRLNRRWYWRLLDRTLIGSLPFCMKFRQSDAVNRKKINPHVIDPHVKNFSKNRVSYNMTPHISWWAIPELKIDA